MDSSEGSGANVPDATRVAIPHADTTSKLPMAAHMALMEAAGASPRSGAGTQRGTARTRTVPARPALAGVFNNNNTDVSLCPGLCCLLPGFHILLFISCTPHMQRL